MDGARWQDFWQVNVMAHIYAARAVLPSMLAAGGGYLLQTASAAGLLTQIGSAPYAVTKHAAVAFAEWLAITYGDRGIKVSCLCPQGVRTPMLEGASAVARNLLGESAIEPEVVADAVIGGLAAERFLILPHPKWLSISSVRPRITIDGSAACGGCNSASSADGVEKWVMRDRARTALRAPQRSPSGRWPTASNHSRAIRPTSRAHRTHQQSPCLRRRHLCATEHSQRAADRLPGEWGRIADRSPCCARKATNPSCGRSAFSSRACRTRHSITDCQPRSCAG